MCLRTLVDFVWPLRRQESELNPAVVFAAYDDAVRIIEPGTPSSDDAKLLDLSATLFDNDAARRASIDKRASALMPAITIAVTLVSGVGFTALRGCSKRFAGHGVVHFHHIPPHAHLSQPYGIPDVSDPRHRSPLYA
jgi:hypothetical protein